MKFTEKFTLKLSNDQSLKLSYVCDKQNKIKSSFVRDLIQNQIEIFEKQNWKIDLSQTFIK